MYSTTVLLLLAACCLPADRHDGRPIHVYPQQLVKLDDKNRMKGTKNKF